MICPPRSYGQGPPDHLFAESLGQVARRQYFDGNAEQGLQFDLDGAQIEQRRSRNGFYEQIEIADLAVTVMNH